MFVSMWWQTQMSILSISLPKQQHDHPPGSPSSGYGTWVKCYRQWSVPITPPCYIYSSCSPPLLHPSLTALLLSQQNYSNLSSSPCCIVCGCLQAKNIHKTTPQVTSQRRATPTASHSAREQLHILSQCCCANSAQRSRCLYVWSLSKVTQNLASTCHCEAGTW